jgi:hypothetical protein
MQKTQNGALTFTSQSRPTTFCQEHHQGTRDRIIIRFRWKRCNLHTGQQYAVDHPDEGVASIPRVKAVFLDSSFSYRHGGRGTIKCGQNRRVWIGWVACRIARRGDLRAAPNSSASHQDRMQPCCSSNVGHGRVMLSRGRSRARKRPLLLPSNQKVLPRQIPSSIPCTDLLASIS